MKQYHGKFPKAKDDIAYEDYNCSSYWEKSIEDSTLVDSTEVSTDNPVMLDENGNPIEGNVENNATDPNADPQATEKHDEHNKQEATEKKKKKQPTYEDVYL